MTGKTLGENIAEYDVRGADRLGAAPELLTRVRPGGERTTQAWTVPSVAAESRSQAAGLAVLESEGEGSSTAGERRRPTVGRATASTPST